jgi:hypothetical protein
MKKTYEKPVLTTEQFDTDDFITASAPQTPLTLDSTHNSFPVDDIIPDITFN